MPNNKKKMLTHCKNGHEFTFENTYVQFQKGIKCRKCKTCRSIYQKDYIEKNRARINKKANEYTKSWAQNVRRHILNHYSKGKLSCICCGESTYQFLTLDHINNNGQEDRKIHGNQLNIMRKLMKNGYPEGYQTLCWNCNLGKRSNKGDCPHKQVKELIPITLDWQSEA